MHTPELVAECAEKGVKAIHIFSSGFSEVEDENGAQLEAEVLSIASRNGIRILGPNCMGLYCPDTGLSFTPDWPNQHGLSKKSGPLGFISQSGANTFYCIREAAARGLHFSKAVSYGNSSDLNETDFLEYLSHDPETEIITAYIEGVKDGAGFNRALKKATQKKPVIVFKCGTTETGTRAAASHTSAVAGSNIIWDGLLEQAGAIHANSIEEMIDVALLFQRSTPPKGRNIAIIGQGGGPSVKAADDCSNRGLTVPVLPARTRHELTKIHSTEAGRIFRNPVDIQVPMGSELLVKSFETIANSDSIDILMIHIGFDYWGWFDREAFVEPAVEAMLRLKDLTSKPVVPVLHSCATVSAIKLASEAAAALIKAGFPVYPSIDRAANALDRFIEYNERVRTIRGEDIERAA